MNAKTTGRLGAGIGDAGTWVGVWGPDPWGRRAAVPGGRAADPAGAVCVGMLIAIASMLLLLGPAEAAYRPDSAEVVWTGTQTWTSSATFQAADFSVGGSTFVVAAGNVGIGTTAPLEKLHIVGGSLLFDLSQGLAFGDAAGPTIFFSDGISSFIRSPSVSGGFRFQNSAGTVNRVTFTDAGDVGIGTTAPGATLDVAGSLRVGSGGTVMSKMESGTIGTCSVADSAGSSGSVSFPSAFGAAPRVFFTPNEPDGAGCVTVRAQGTTTTGFSWTSFVGGTPTACNCIFWLAIGP